jgi:ATP-dependent 26S proteasome regulatory subunit
VETHEEDRILSMLRELSVNPRFPDPRKPDDATRPIYGWSLARGIAEIASTGSQVMIPPDLTDPIAALQWFLDWGKTNIDTPAILAMFDPCPAFAKAIFTRLVREAAIALRSRKQNLFLVAPSIDLPADLRHDVTLITYPLPTFEELVHLVSVKVDTMRDKDVATDLKQVDIETAARALTGMTMMKAEEAMRLAIASTGRFYLEQALPILLQQKAQMCKASGALEYFHTQASWSDIGGLDLLKQYAAKCLRTFEPAAARFGVHRRRGILLVGLPGCGKSLSAKAIAGNRLPLLRLNVGALFGELVGQSERQTRQALSIVDAIDQCVLHVDEIDKGLGESAGDRDGNTSQRVFGTFLTWMEETSSHAFVVATANRISVLRPELVRRFDTVFFIDLPDPISRKQILEIHLRKRKQDPTCFDLAHLVSLTEWFVGSEIEQIVEDAVMEAYCSDQQVTTDILIAQAEQKQGNKLTTIMGEELDEMRQWASRARAASSAQATGIRTVSAEDAMEL